MKQRTLVWSLAAAGGLLSPLSLAARPAASPPLQVRPAPGNAGRVVVELRGAPAAALRRYLASDASSARRDGVFSLSVKRAGAPIPMLARLEWSGGVARLMPQAPLTRGLVYVASFNGPQVQAGLPRMAREYRVPVDTRPSAGEIAAVYPQDATVPANLLKFYLCFSVPMAQGSLFRHVRLLDERGKPISQALREVELWSPDHRRATVWISPGRTKQSLGLSEALGPVLLPGHRYTLEVTPGLPDTSGRKLKTAFRHAFRTSGPDHDQPRITNWRVTTPTVGSLKPLTVGFGEPLDRFLARRLIGVEDAQGRPVSGEVRVSADSRSWSFQPRASWQAGRYALVAGAELEDLAGNSLLRPFEAPVGTAAKPAANAPTYRREFTVGGQ